jgi:hypothetical protein
MEVVRMREIGLALLFVICIFSPLYAAQSTIVDVEGSARMEDYKSRKQTEQEVDCQPAEERKQIKRDGRFIAYDNGTVLDTQTNLMWAAKDNGRDINWANAKSYCEKYRGGGYTDWRLPTQDELAGLYDLGKTQRNEAYPYLSYPLHLSESIDVTACCPWAAETHGSDAASFIFNDGGRTWFLRSDSYDNRALPVRSGR